MTRNRGSVVGVDVGGTFTDVVLRRPEIPAVTVKVLTTPDDPVVGILRGIAAVLAEAGLTAAAVDEFVHGTTLATNTVLQHRGAQVVLVTTAGFADLFRLGRSARVEEERFDLRHGRGNPPLAPVDIVEVEERIGADGSVVRPLVAEVAAARIAEVADHHGVSSIAVCLVHSWAEPAHEAALGRALRATRPDLHVSLSSEVWPELREHDRASTTLLAAALAPSMSTYLARLGDALTAAGSTAPLWVMDSAGGLVRPEEAAARPVLLLESGGAAGVRAAADIAAELGLEHAIAFDMGGTTAKVALVDDGGLSITHEFQLGGTGSFGVPRAGTGLPVKGPVVDLCEIGAGGGSLARVDAGGSLQVGPQSAGAVPGPAAYGAGGSATVTDANVVLGVLRAGPLNDAISIDASSAADAVERHVGAPLGLDTATAARAIRAIAVAKMAGAIRMVTVQRGIDPRGRALIATGGAGPMHAAELADEAGISLVVVPAHAGVASAFGLTSAPPAAERVRSLPLAATEEHLPIALGVLGALSEQALAAVDTPGATVTAALDMRLRGQAHSIRVEVPPQHVDVAAVLERFTESYRRAYGVDPVGPAEFLTFRARATAASRTFAPPPPRAVGDPAATTRMVIGGEVEVWSWPELPSRWAIVGPALVEGEDTTVHIPSGWRAEVHPLGHLVLVRSSKLR